MNPNEAALDDNIEIWVSAKCYHHISKVMVSFDKYEVSNMGKFRKRVNLEIMNGSRTRRGYDSYHPSIGTKSYGILANRAVLSSFIGAPSDKDMTADHIDRNRSNNCLINLRWSTVTKQNQNREKFTQTGQKVPVHKIDDITGERVRYPSMGDVPGFSTSAVNFAVAHHKIVRGYRFEVATIDLIDGEVWKPWLSAEISNQGRVKRISNGKEYEVFLKPSSNGYLSITGSGRKLYLLHRVVYFLFGTISFDIDDASTVVNHFNENRLDNRIENLEPMSQHNNLRHSKCLIYRVTDRETLEWYECEGRSEVKMLTGVSFSHLRKCEKTSREYRNWDILLVERLAVKRMRESLVT
jgi:hypothetical protein